MTMNEWARCKKIFRKWRIVRERGSSLLESRRTEIVHIEFTSHCNLKCVFCPVSQPGYKSFDMDPETLTGILDILKMRRPGTVVVNGHGETTIYPHWNRYCNSMLDAGMPLHIISNFAKELSVDEIDTLARFQSVEISCDSHDPEVFRSLRRGADLQTLCSNVRQLEAARARRGGSAPSISFSCVVSDRNVLHLPEYVAFGRDLGVNHFTFCNLTKHPDVEGVVNARHITEMELALLSRVQKSLDDSFRFLRKSRIKFFVQQGLLDSLKEKMQSAAAGADFPPPGNEAASPPGTKRYSSTRPGGQTRDCLDPWSFVLFHANGEVSPCCWQYPVLTLGKRQPVADAFNCMQVKKLRHQLLGGDLSEKCLQCPSRGWTTRAAFQKKVMKYLYPGLHWPFSPAPALPNLPPAAVSVVQHGEGWFPEEQEDGLPDPERRRWRWISRQAHATVRNPRRRVRLVIRGFVHPAALMGQKISVHIGEALLDEFSPRSVEFNIEYEIPAELWGEMETAPIVLETARTFIPSQSVAGSGDDRVLGIQIHQLQLF